MSFQPRPFLIVAVATLFVTTALAQSVDFRGVEQEMSAEEREHSGVDQLTPSQLDALNSWLRNRFGAGIADSEVATTIDQPVDIDQEVERRVAKEVAAVKAKMAAAEAAVEQQKPFEAKITGGFSGWSRKTVFTLDNGQVWRQRHGSPYRHTTGDTRVRFDRNFLGLWTMTVLSSGRTVGVRRLD